MESEKLGEYAFLAGVVIAVLAGLVPGVVAASTVSLVLVVLGIIVGLLNIQDKETTPFLVAAIALVAAGTAGFDGIPSLGSYLSSILGNVGVFVAPAAVIVAVKSVYSLATK